MQAWRQYPLFDNIYKLVGVPVITVQLRYDGWVTELQDQDKVRSPPPWRALAGMGDVCCTPRGSRRLARCQLSLHAAATHDEGRLVGPQQAPVSAAGGVGGRCLCTPEHGVRAALRTPCCAQARNLKKAAGLDNLLYSADVFFSCFADLALVSPEEYFREGQGSLMQCVITPAAPYMPWTNERIAEETDRQVRRCLLLAPPRCAPSGLPGLMREDVAVEMGRDGWGGFATAMGPQGRRQAEHVFAPPARCAACI